MHVWSRLRFAYAQSRKATERRASDSDVAVEAAGLERYLRRLEAARKMEATLMRVCGSDRVSSRCPNRQGPHNRRADALSSTHF